MEILYNENTIEEIDDALMKNFREAVQLCFEEEKLPCAEIEISVTFASAEEIREINQAYRELDKPTDVLSFPQYEKIELAQILNSQRKSTAAAENIPLGDVVICPDIAKVQAAEFGHTERRELVYLFVHSIFHLLGYDHLTEQEKELMRAKEETVMSALHLEREGA